MNITVGGYMKKKSSKLATQKYREKMKADPIRYAEYLEKEKKRNSKRRLDPVLNQSIHESQKRYREKIRGTDKARFNCINRTCADKGILNQFEDEVLVNYWNDTTVECHYFGILMCDYFDLRGHAYGKDRCGKTEHRGDGIRGGNYHPDNCVNACVEANDLREVLNMTSKTFRLLCTPIRIYNRTKRKANQLTAFINKIFNPFLKSGLLKKNRV